MDSCFRSIRDAVPSSSLFAEDAYYQSSADPFIESLGVGKRSGKVKSNGNTYDDDERSVRSQAESIR